MAIARTEWTKFYLHPGGRTAPESVEGSPEPMQQGMEVTGRVACYLEASID